jgi:hypothetical protein
VEIIDLDLLFKIPQKDARIVGWRRKKALELNTWGRRPLL